MTGAVEAGATGHFEVLHALAIKAMAPPAALAAVTGVDVLPGLVVLRDGGWAEHLAGRDLWRITKQGRALHARLVAERITEPARGRLRAGYERFLPLDRWFKGVCTRWQVRDGVPNDHSDARYTGALVVELGRLHERVDSLLLDLGRALDRLTGYRARLSAALDRVRDGDRTAFTGVLCESYHDVWMELHRDLQLVLGVDRHAEETGAAR
ncbi:MarR family transcriptional regulator [Saccharothrix sp. NPDC042600]|uniref:MarR family transcriptional regulator n=1 Tax=Saccharothrix TaxID=2071 RepID=UPI0033E7F34F|nr:hypothetical protein GCM10017745_58270 [Saccharothrix mutabilis subsp. capreolus]